MAAMTRTRSEVQRTPRSAVRSLWRSYRDSTLFVRLAQWARHYLQLVLKSRRPFPHYSTIGNPQPGIIPIKNNCVLGLAGDWGTGTASAYAVADQMRMKEPDVTIHLGDVYFSGTVQEYTNYFLPVDAWPRGKDRTFALNGNHEMYSGGRGYFDEALPTLGQGASYFCLSNTYWRILGLDSGYYARIFPFLELSSHWIRLHQEINHWLASFVFGDPTDKRPVILLTHHQWFSAFKESEYKRLGKDLSEYLEHVVVWLWGHEHRFSGYKKFGLGGLPPVRARCIGHGGMPIELLDGNVKRSDRNLVFVDERPSDEELDGRPIGYNGFAMLDLNQRNLSLNYYDQDGTHLMGERWTQTEGGVSGSVTYFSNQLSLANDMSPQDLVSP